MWKSIKTFGGCKSKVEMHISCFGVQCCNNSLHTSTNTLFNYMQYKILAQSGKAMHYKFLLLIAIPFNRHILIY